MSSVHKIREIVDYYLYLCNLEPQETNYSRHCKPAKKLLELYDNDLEKAKRLLDQTNEWADSMGYDYTIETCFKRYLFIEPFSRRREND